MKVSSRQIPGRLRLRFPQLKGEPLAAAEVASALRQVAGVVSVDPSPVTGSVLVTYTVGGEHESRLWPALRQVLEEHGLTGEGAALSRHAGGGRPLLTGAGGMLGRAVVDRLAERSALALVAALL
jgi:hypothetical protein